MFFQSAALHSAGHIHTALQTKPPVCHWAAPVGDGGYVLWSRAAHRRSSGSFGQSVKWYLQVPRFKNMVQENSSLGPFALTMNHNNGNKILRDTLSLAHLWEKHMYVCVHIHIRLSSDLALLFVPFNFVAWCLLFGRWFCVHKVVCMLSESQASNWIPWCVFKLLYFHKGSVDKKIGSGSWLTRIDFRHSFQARAGHRFVAEKAAGWLCSEKGKHWGNTEMSMALER